MTPTLWPEIPDVLLPTQLVRRITTPEQRLMLAVLDDAVSVLRGFGGRVPNREARHPKWAEARTWVLSEDTFWPFSFLRICDAVGFDAGAIRRSLAPLCELSAEPSFAETVAQLCPGVYANHPSVYAAAKACLRDAGQPMTMGMLVRALLAGGLPVPPRRRHSTIAARVYDGARRTGEVVRRGSWWSLVAWEGRAA